MSERTTKFLAFVAIGGVALQFGSCLGSTPWRFVLTDAALSAAYEFVWDNETVFDMFQDDFGTATQYDDRFTTSPGRSEPSSSNVANLGAGN